MRILILIVSFILFSPTVSQAQILKEVYKDFLKYGTVYGAGDISNSIEAAEPTYFLRTNPDGSLYSIPDVVDNTPNYPFDYRYGFGIRKLARFDYERKPKNFYDGTEEQLVFSAPSSLHVVLRLKNYNKKLQKNSLFLLTDCERYILIK